MKKLAILILVVGLMLPSIHTNAAANSKTNATWIWNPWSLTTAAGQNKVINFLVKNNVTDVYLQIDQEVERKTYQQFIAKATAKSISVHALDGAAKWALAGGQAYADSMFAWLKNYQKSSAANQRFNGVHFDVEPYILTEWNTDRDAVVLAYQKLIKRSSQLSSKLSLDLSIDMPFWFDEITFANTYGKSNLAKWAIKNTDAVTIMAYRNTATGANGINSLVKTEVQYAKDAGKAINIGVETGESAEGSNISFYEKSKTYMKNELAKVAKAYPQENVNLAVHYVDTWMQIK
ncbi:amidase [Niallia circulans]|uniref:Amidase n=1 Tax=Niallia circulans TaxID=1397 RepID=A0A553SMP3_NIACI|nr:amidase [Niallia circulans]TRZ38238.1 amidase [Niallia circulans]